MSRKQHFLEQRGNQLMGLPYDRCISEKEKYSIQSQNNPNTPKNTSCKELRWLTY